MMFDVIQEPKVFLHNNSSKSEEVVSYTSLVFHECHSKVKDRQGVSDGCAVFCIL